MPEGWVVAEGEVDGLPVIVRLDEGAGTPEERARLPWNLVVRVPFKHPTEHGLYAPPEGDRLEEIEEAFDAALEARGGRLAAAVTLDGRRDLIAYIGDEEAADAAVDAAEDAAGDYELEVISQPDPSWEVYDDVAAPLLEAEQGE